MRKDIVIAAMLMAGGCAEPVKDVRAADYDQSCTVPEDCVAVLEGNQCCPSGPNAVNESAAAAFFAEINEADCSGGDRDSCLVVTLLRRPTCTDGVCVATDEVCEPRTACEPAPADTE